MPTHKTRAQERIDALETPSVTQLIDEVALVQAERDAAIQEAAENLAALQRSAADFQNYKRRTEQERETTAGLANESLLRKVIAIADDFDRAIEAMPEPLAADGWVQGIAAIDRKLRMLLESEGVTPIEALGRPFDPRQHEALTQIETTDVPEDTIVAEIQRGYRVRDRILRPSLVAVATSPSQAADDLGATAGRSGRAAPPDQPGVDAGSGGND
ncbi:MAG TPA: nucleotide exchange factor GrpE [Candidatus Saccharimonadia bacterium]|nr:nucleotide exchange factor GrpE [Candidatus Saccharimonadia bacterium]